MSTFRKVTYLESFALRVFSGFTRHIKTQTWVSGIELGDKNYQGKPGDFSRRTVTIYQGNRDDYQQKLEVHFCYNSDCGWLLDGVIFSGHSWNSNNGTYEWKQAFRGGPWYGDEFNWRFVPCRYDGYYFRHYDRFDAEQQAEFTAACQGKYPHVVAS